jgi:hypothetical protein
MMKISEKSIFSEARVRLKHSGGLKWAFDERKVQECFARLILTRGKQCVTQRGRCYAVMSVVSSYQGRRKGTLINLKLIEDKSKPTRFLHHNCSSQLRASQEFVTLSGQR